MAVFQLTKAPIRTYRSPLASRQGRPSHTASPLFAHTYRTGPMRLLSRRGTAVVYPEGRDGGPDTGETKLQPLPPWRRGLYTLVNLLVHLRKSFQFW
jgi:hypothetical protein